MNRAACAVDLEGFFSGGARIVHSDVVLGLHEGGQRHAVLSVNGEMYREETRQRMEDDVCYRSLTAAGVPVTSLGRTPGTPGSQTFTGPELPGRHHPGGGRRGRPPVPQGAAARPAQPGRPAPAARPGLSAPLRPREAGGGPGTSCGRRSPTAGSPPGSVAPNRRAPRTPRPGSRPACCTSSERRGSAAIPPRPFRRALLRTSLGIQERAPVIVFAARYATMKNVPLLPWAAGPGCADSPTVTS